MKSFVRSIHLYLGLVSGLVIMVTCLSGALLAFQDELEHSLHHNRYYVAPSGRRLPVSQLVEKFKLLMPDVTIANIRVYTASDRTIELAYKSKKKKEKGDKNAPSPKRKEGAKQKLEESLRAYMNPYTGNIIELVNPRKSFFATVEGLHRKLLADDVGKLIVGISTSIFLFIIITGIILWWPPNRHMLRQRLAIKRSAGWKRTNHDWHIVLGFYTSLLLFAFAFTGLAWSFKWFNDSIYYLSGSPLKNPEPPRSAIAFEGNKAGVLDNVMIAAAAVYNNAIYYQANMSKDDSGSIAVNILPANPPHKGATEVLYFDQYSGRQLGKLAFHEKSKGARIRSYFLPIHTGAILGMPGRILAFIATLLGSTFPVTGVIMWINRTRKKQKLKAYPPAKA